MDKITESLLKMVSDWDEGVYEGAYNIRENGGCAGRNSTDNIKIEPKEGGKGIDIYVEPGTKDEKVYIPACISKISDNSQHNYMILDKGSEDGVEVGYGVITAKGVIGIIDAVSDNYSYAISFKNHMMSISARLRKDGPVGTMSWDGKSRSNAMLREIPHHIQHSPGDTVYTSGYSAIFPADIPIGITGDARIVNGSTYEMDVTLFEDFGSLRYAIIVGNIDNDQINALEEQVQ